MKCTYSHSQWLFYEFVSKITNKLVKQSLRVTVKHCTVRWEINCTLAIINLKPSCSKVSAESGFGEREKNEVYMEKM